MAPRATRLSVAPGAKLSGSGRVTDNYYHFLVDFSVRVFNECGLPSSPTNRTRRCVIYVRRCEGLRDLSLANCSNAYPGELSIFHPATGSNFETRFAQLFGTSVTLHHVSSAALAAAQAGGAAPPLSFRNRTRCRIARSAAELVGPMPHDACSEWSRQPPAFFDRFRRAVLSGALGGPPERALANAPVAVRRVVAHAPAVLVIERTNATSNRLRGRAIKPALKRALLDLARRERLMDPKELHFVEPSVHMRPRDRTLRDAHDRSTER
jgi:hypothetical protein